MSVYLPLQIESQRPMVQPPLHVFVVVPCVLSLHVVNDESADTSASEETILAMYALF